MCGRSVCMRISSALLLVVAFQWRSGRLLVVLAVGGSVYIDWVDLLCCGIEIQSVLKSRCAF